MLYLSNAGTKAEVNDGGVIRRLPLKGEGVPPRPGSKVTPGLNDCCCPTDVKLVPATAEEAQRRDPRRDSKRREDVPIASTDRCVGTYGTQVGYYGGGYPPNENAPSFEFKELIGKPFKLLLFPEDSVILPTPGLWIEWDTKKNTFKLVKLPSKGQTLYLWVGGSSGTVGNNPLGDGGGAVGNITSLTKKINSKYTDAVLKKPIPKAEDYEIIYKYYDTNRVAWGSQVTGDFPSYDFDPPIKPGDKHSTKFKSVHPKGEMWIFLEGYSDRDIFLNWYKNAESIKYELVC